MQVSAFSEYYCINCYIPSFMPTLESQRFPVLDEESCYLRQRSAMLFVYFACFYLHDRADSIIQVGSDSLSCFYIYKFVTTNTFNCHDTIAQICFKWDFGFLNVNTFSYLIITVGIWIPDFKWQKVFSLSNGLFFNLKAMTFENQTKIFSF